MIKHVVMWKFKPDTEELQNKFLDGLRSLKGQIDSIVSMEVYKNEAENCDCDAVLIATFIDFDGLNAYKNHPKHLEVSAICKSIRIERHAVDSVCE